MPCQCSTPDPECIWIQLLILFFSVRFCTNCSKLCVPFNDKHWQEQCQHFFDIPTEQVKKTDCSGIILKRFSVSRLADRKLLLDIIRNKDYIVVIQSENRSVPVFCLYRSAIQHSNLPEELQYAYFDL